MNLSLLDVIVTASVSSIFALIVYNWQKTGDFRREYLKEILQKRIIAYEKVSTIVAKLNVFETTTKGRKVLTVYIRDNESEEKATRFYDLLVEVYDIWNYSLWINSDLLDLCRIAYRILHKDYVEVREKFGTEECIRIGQDSYPKLDVTLRKIQIQLVEDLRQLNDIESHFNSKSLSYSVNLDRAKRRLENQLAKKP